MTTENQCKELAVRRVSVQRVGPNYLKLVRRLNREHNSQISNSSSNENLTTTTNAVEVDINYLKSLDPKEWKQQDHYKVLGLEHMRIKATEHDIKQAYRRMVLKHHPDKRKAKGEDVNTDDDYFTCITRAYEILGTPKLRISYDSVDPEFDDSLPTASEIENNYFEVFQKYFDLNARWSEKKNVPAFGSEDATREEVDKFYNFWYDFESWREFSYLDEEDKEKGQDRDERRWIEKENRVARIKRKKEEMSRIRSLVDLAFNNDKRILRFKKEEKERKLAMKRAKMDAAQSQKDEEERILREAQAAKEQAEKAEQKRIEKIRLEREQQKKLIKKERKAIRDKAKENNYFTNSDKDLVKNMEGVEKICEMLNLLELQQFNKELAKGGSNVFFSKLKSLDKKLEEEREGVNQKKPAEKAAVKPVDKNLMWNNENVQLLIKAVNLFPAGTVQRWEVIANFMNQHSTFANERKFQAKDVLNKAKSLQSGDFSKSSLKTQANEAAFESFEKSKKEAKIVNETTDISINTEQEKVQPVKKEPKQSAPKETKKIVENGKAPSKAPAAAVVQNGTSENQDKQEKQEKPTQSTEKSSKTWSKEEQSLLEQAIKSYPISTPDRWERIAECIPNRTKKDCLRRVKELVELVNSKKEAQQRVK